MEISPVDAPPVEVHGGWREASASRALLGGQWRGAEFQQLAAVSRGARPRHRPRAASAIIGSLAVGLCCNSLRCRQ